MFLLKVFLSFCLIFYPFCALCKTEVTLKAVVVSYDKKHVTVYHRGRKIKVSKKSIPDRFEIKAGAEVDIVLDYEKLKKMN